LIEAMACGLPVIATNAESVRDILEAGEQAGDVIVRDWEADTFA
jgi:glycosyltransferase involved in cell wall biosynthesis